MKNSRHTRILEIIADHVIETQADLIEKLSKLSNKYFRSHIKNVYSVSDWSKTENQSVFSANQD